MLSYMYVRLLVSLSHTLFCHSSVLVEMDSPQSSPMLGGATGEGVTGGYVTCDGGDGGKSRGAVEKKSSKTVSFAAVEQSSRCISIYNVHVYM